MIRPARPMSNRERQRRFRERHPGYYQRLRARERADYEAMVAQRAAAAAVQREPLALPAPAVTIDIPGMTSIPAIATHDALLVPLREESSTTAARTTAR